MSEIYGVLTIGAGILVLYLIGPQVWRVLNDDEDARREEARQRARWDAIARFEQRQRRERDQ